MIRVLGALAAWCTVVWANPYPDASQVPRDPINKIPFHPGRVLTPREIARDGFDVVRVEVDWDAAHDAYHLGQVVIEHSGTDAMQRRAPHVDTLGSFQGTLTDFQGSALAHDSIGTGQEFRKLTRQITFRFPRPESAVLFRMAAENPTSGQREEVVRELIDPSTLPNAPARLDDLEVQVLKPAESAPALRVNLYADGYTAARRARFWQDAQKAVSALKDVGFPELARFEIRGVYAPSNQAIGSARDLGLPVPEWDSFLGLFYPYWEKFGRWTDVVYPTREAKYRAGIGRVPYDYPIVLIDNDDYWGIGNFNELTAVPASHYSFRYLLLHEFGHFFGLNEEYEGGGPTELAFAPGIDEPWSQNISFMRDPKALKWNRLLIASTPLPTPQSYWEGDGPLGAYRGGYADTPPLNRSYKPGYACVMTNGDNFCTVCRQAVLNKIHFDLGQ